MDQQTEALQVLKEIRADIRTQTELTQRAQEEARAFRQDAMRLQKRGTARVFWTMAAVGLLFGLAMAASLWFFIKSQR